MEVLYWSVPMYLKIYPSSVGHERIQRQCNSPLTIIAQQDIVVIPPAYLFTQCYIKCTDNEWNMNRLEWRPPTRVLRQSIVVMFRLLIQPLPEFTLNTFHNWVSQCSSVLACALTLVETWIACFTAGDICRNQISSLLDHFGDPMLRNGVLQSVQLWPRFPCSWLRVHTGALSRRWSPVRCEVYQAVYDVSSIV